MAHPDDPLIKTAKSERKALGFAKKLLPGLLLTFHNVTSVEHALYASDENKPAMAIVDKFQLVDPSYDDVYHNGGMQPQHHAYLQTYQEMLERLTQLTDSAPEW